MDKIRAILFGMTGFGNNALEILLNHSSIKTIAVFTSETQAGHFPYYECENLQDAVLRNGITRYEGLNLRGEKTYDLIKKLSPDIIIVSSFSQIIPHAIISLPRLGVINVHPSLLPKYRGATPTVWALINGEKETGVTVHFIEDESIDSGRIIAQAKLNIDASDNDGILRRKLAILSEKVLTEAISLVLTNDRYVFPLQNESEATFYPKRSLKDACIDIRMPVEEIMNRVRAMTPYPGAYVCHEGRQYIVENAAVIGEGYANDTFLPDRNILVVNTADGMVRFQIKGMN